MSRLPFIVSVLCLVAAAIIAGAAWWVTRNGPSGADAGSSGRVVSTGKADVGGPFQLVNQDGRAVDQTILNGKWTVVFFGFTFCPDVCPTTLQTLAATKRELGPQGRDLQVVFITIDPQRDTPAALKEYLASTGLPEAIGLTGTPEQIDSTAKAYRIFYAKKGEGDDYTMDHSTSAYLMNPKGEFSRALAYGMTSSQKAQVIRDAMRQGS